MASNVLEFGQSFDFRLGQLTSISPSQTLAIMNAVVLKRMRAGVRIDMVPLNAVARASTCTPPNLLVKIPPKKVSIVPQEAELSMNPFSTEFHLNSGSCEIGNDL